MPLVLIGSVKKATIFYEKYDYDTQDYKFRQPKWLCPEDVDRINYLPCFFFVLLAYFEKDSEEIQTCLVPISPIWMKRLISYE